MDLVDNQIIYELYVVIKNGRLHYEEILEKAIYMHGHLVYKHNITFGTNFHFVCMCNKFDFDLKYAISLHKR